MKQLNYRMLNVLKHNKDGSFATHTDRKNTLLRACDQLLEMGYKIDRPNQLKSKHVERLINHWKDSEKLSSGTIKNRVAHLRWLAEKINKKNIVARGNGAYGIERRSFVAQTSKAGVINPSKILEIEDLNLRASAMLQHAFGLRREEAIKFQPDYAMTYYSENKIILKGSWAKGGKSRIIPVKSQYQRDVIAFARELQKTRGQKSLIPNESSYISQANKYQKIMRQLNMGKTHALRHGYAQRRYEEITGWKPPVNGGPSSRDMTPEQKAMDENARLIISSELGHERIQITKNYLG